MYWYHDAIFYSIYPLGAVNGKHDNDYALSTEGLDRLCDWVDHMANMNCNAVNLGPVFQSKTHGYDTTDYRKIDSRLGTDDQFAGFVRRCHDRGIRVVVDGVFNHTGRDFFAFKELQAHREGSPYRDWYCGVNFGGNTPLNDGFGYEAWRGHFELPRLNPHNPAVRDYLFQTAREWIDRFDVDGIRLDCADCLDFGFMKDLRRVCTERKADFWLMGEIIHGDYTRWANSDTLHSVTNYECSKGLYSSHNDGNMHEIAHSLNRQFGPGGIYKDLMLYNFADNHDLNRLADTVKKQEYLRNIYTILFTMPGVPSMYYGSEWGLRGVSDRVTDWALRPQIDIRSVTFDNPELMASIATLAKVRAGSEALRHGQYSQVLVTSLQFAFRRSTGGDTVVVALNCDDKPVELAMPLDGDAWVDLLEPGQVYQVKDGRVVADIPAYGARVLQQSTGAAAPPLKSQPEALPKPTARPAIIIPAGPAPLRQDVLVTRMEEMAPMKMSEHPRYASERREVLSVRSGNQSDVAFLEIPPGRAAYPYHYHAATEEIFYITGGTGTLYTPDSERTVTTGDLIFFPASPKGAHKLVNLSNSEPLTYLDIAIGPVPNVAFFPDSGKVGIVGQDFRHLFRLGNEPGYYEGE